MNRNIIYWIGTVAVAVLMLSAAKYGIFGKSEMKAEGLDRAALFGAFVEDMRRHIIH